MRGLDNVYQSSEFLTSVCLELKNIEATILRNNLDRHLCFMAPRIKVVCPPLIEYGGLVIPNDKPIIIPTGEITIEVRTEEQAEDLFNMSGVADSNDMWKDFHSYDPKESLFYAIAPPDSGMGVNWKAYGSVPREKLRKLFVEYQNSGFTISQSER